MKIRVHLWLLLLLATPATAFHGPQQEWRLCTSPIILHDWKKEKL